MSRKRAGLSELEIATTRVKIHLAGQESKEWQMGFNMQMQIPNTIIEREERFAVSK